MPDQKSLILVTVDCLRADHCGFMGYPVPTTPFLDRLAAQSFVFPNALVAGVPTYYSFPAILASRYPLALGREMLGLAPRETNLASVLKNAGYQTAFFGAGNPYLSAQSGYDFGFDTFRDFSGGSIHDDSANPLTESNWTTKLNFTLANLSHKIPAAGEAYDELYFQYCQHRAAPRSPSLDQLRRFPAANVIVDHAEAWFASVGRDAPFFLWLHFMDPHAPYYPTEEALHLLEENKTTAARARYLNAYWNRSDLESRRLRRHSNEVIAMYDAGIRWVDAQLSRLVEDLRRLNLWDQCTVALTADHGEEFLDHDGRYHAPSLTEELIHVPLLVRVPGVTKKNICKNPFSLLHLGPTLLGSMNVPIPGDFQGRNLWPNLQQGTVWPVPAIAECLTGSTNPFSTSRLHGSRHLAIRETQYKLILTFGQKNEILTESFFDLESDPAERYPLPIQQNRPERRRLLQAALDHLQRSDSFRNSDAYLRMRIGRIARAWDEPGPSPNRSLTPEFQNLTG
jgi:arylsulfatase A-like enzyme